jgi:hypothetical protein
MTAISPTNATRKIELGSVVLTVLSQPPENHQDENDNSIGLRIYHRAKIRRIRSAFSSFTLPVFLSIHWG